MMRFLSMRRQWRSGFLLMSSGAGRMRPRLFRATWFEKLPTRRASRPLKSAVTERQVVARTTSNMPIKVGEVEALFRYPVKSMSGELLEVAELGWHGLEGDRRLAFRRVDDRGGFPWLTATKLPDLILFAPQRRGPADEGALPTH